MLGYSTLIDFTTFWFLADFTKQQQNNKRWSSIDIRVTPVTFLFVKINPKIHCNSSSFINQTFSFCIHLPIPLSLIYLSFYTIRPSSVYLHVSFKSPYHFRTYTRGPPFSLRSVISLNVKLDVPYLSLIRQ